MTSQVLSATKNVERHEIAASFEENHTKTILTKFSNFSARDKGLLWNSKAGKEGVCTLLLSLLYRFFYCLFNFEVLSNEKVVNNQRH